MSPRSGWEFAGLTNPGCVRSNNEDSLCVDSELGLLVVADGMGGHNSGEVASALAVSTIRDQARRLLPAGAALAPENGGARVAPRGRQLEYLVQNANTVIYERGRVFPKNAGMGTTVVAVLVDEKSLSVAHVGDSRLYLLRQGVLSQLTEDHSLVGDQVRHGLITPEAAAHSTLQNILTRAVGAEAEVKVDVSEHPVLPGDVLLLATDGLNKMVGDDQIARILATQADPGRMSEALVKLACRAGGLDNITVVCGRLLPLPARRFWGEVAKFLKF